MPIALILFGGLLITSAIKGTEHKLGDALAKDFTGSPSFLSWLAAITLIGGLGYVPVLTKASNYMLVLIIVAILFSDRGFFANLSSTLTSGATPAASVPYPTGSSGSGSSSSSSSSGGGGFDVSSIASVAALALL